MVLQHLEIILRNAASSFLTHILTQTLNTNICSDRNQTVMKKFLEKKRIL